MKTFDPQCYELACYFLNDYETRVHKISEEDRNNLAAHIQGSIEDWMEEEDRNSEAKEEAARERWAERNIEERGFA